MTVMYDLDIYNKEGVLINSIGDLVLYNKSISLSKGQKKTYKLIGNEGRVLPVPAFFKRDSTGRLWSGMLDADITFDGVNMSLVIRNSNFTSYTFFEVLL